MKKITLFFAALAVAFSSANAQVVFGNYCKTTNVFTAGGTSIGEPGGARPAVNPSCLSFAVQVDNFDLIAALDKDDRYTLAFAGVRNGTQASDHFEFNGIRMIKAPGDDYVFYIEEWDLGAIGTGSDAPHIHSELIVASTAEANEAGFEFWWDDNTTAFGWTPTYKYLGQYNVNNTVCTGLGNCGGTGIEDVLVEDAEIVAYYNLLGQKLAGEPTSGIFIVKLSNGKSVKIAK